MSGTLLTSFLLGIAMVECTPIIGIDLWEHAYFHRYEGDKVAYLSKFWECVDWEKVSFTYEKYNLDAAKLGPLLE